MKVAVSLVLLAVLVAAVLPAVAAACPDCKDAASDAETPGGSANLGRGFYWSILLMVAAPFAVAGGVTLAILRARRRRARESAVPAGLARSASLSPRAPGARV
jgi:hypothetical protein